ncbi:MAG: 2-amino-4-hydroxy-6-hydroxymethyldihydropteridine diphosphokinase [Phycisphaerae bacterium]
MPQEVFVALGSNLGDPPRQIAEAIRALGQLPGTRLIAHAQPRWYAPVGGPPGQGDFLNTAAQLQTDLEPAGLLDQLLAIELHQGRVRSAHERNGPRTMDIDLLFYGPCMIHTPHLCVPHPRLAERLFVLEPLSEIAPEFIHPAAGLSVAVLLNRLRSGDPWKFTQEEPIRCRSFTR